MFFLAFVLFPDSSHRVAKQSISEPYQNWKELLEDTKNHVFTEHHLNTIKQIHENNEQPRKRYWRYNIEKKIRKSLKTIDHYTGIILRYVFEGKPRERLFKYDDCDRTTGKVFCNSIFKVFEFIESLLSISKIADVRQWMERQTCRGKIKDEQFFLKRKLPSQFTTTVPIMISMSYLANVRKCQEFAEATWNIFQIFTKATPSIWRLCWAI